MHISDFDFKLPPELIPYYPLPERSQSRLMHLNKINGAIHHRQFSDLPNLLLPGDLLVFNDTRVIPARLFGKKITGGKVEILIEKILSDTLVFAHAKSSKSLQTGLCIELEKKYRATFLERENNLWKIEFNTSVSEIMRNSGHIPLPSYIKRSDEELDKTRYQTIYATKEGAIAAPTAGLHFDNSLLQKIKEKGIDIAFLTLHVGAGTFKPVKVENIAEHRMHDEYFEISEKTCEQIINCKKRRGRIIAVGTTTVRSLETIAARGIIKPYVGETNIFIYPGYSFRCVDAIITNFHLPKSTLLMLVSAFAGRENIMTAYAEAIKERYRFFSYGDAMLIA